MEMVVLILLIVLIGIRSIECFLFIKKVSRVCQDYDMKHIETNELLLLEMLERKDYYTTSNWSAFNFLYLKGPNPLYMFFSFKPLTIKAQYTKKVVEKLMKYEIN